MENQRTAHNFVDLTGKRFGRWLVLERAKSNHKRVAWTCRCDCGVERAVIGQVLTCGDSTSCGCGRGRGATYSFMGHTNGRQLPQEYRTWIAMRQRCLNPAHDHFDRYGGRGIKVCDRWQSFQNFIEDMGTKPTPAHTLDRIDNNGNYEPSNCRWATRKEQAQNRTYNIKWQHRNRDEKGRFD